VASDCRQGDRFAHGFAESGGECVSEFVQHEFSPDLFHYRVTGIVELGQMLSGLLA